MGLGLERPQLPARKGQEENAGRSAIRKAAANRQVQLHSHLTNTMHRNGPGILEAGIGFDGSDWNTVIILYYITLYYIILHYIYYIILYYIILYYIILYCIVLYYIILYYIILYYIIYIMYI